MTNTYFPTSSSVSTTTSPTVSVWSRGHSAKSSGSSASFTSSPVQGRTSLDLYGTQKKLEDVREEEDIPSRRMCSFDDYRCGDSSYLVDNAQPVSPYPGYSLTDQDSHSTTSSHKHHSKRQRSLDGPRRSVTQGFSSSISSLSRRWRNRSVMNPSLSINTSTTPVASPRSSMDHSNYYNRTASVGSTSQDIYSPASLHSFMEEPIPESEVVPIYIDDNDQLKDVEEEDEGRATTPLLPPTMLNLKQQESPIQSPLQSPSIAPTHLCHTSVHSYDKQGHSYLPSPPLSNRPSFASMPRVRANTATQDIPTLQLLSERLDPWTVKLGHADFSIHPEPYQPNYIDLDNYKEFRDNWAQARKQYSQHLARTAENYGETSKVYRLTEEKWGTIDEQWKKYEAQLSTALSPQLQRLSDGPTTPDSPISLLEKPVTRVVVPHLDKSGKFPEIGDTDIIGPLSVGVAKVPELQRGTLTPPSSPKKRNFIRAIGDIFRS